MQEIYICARNPDKNVDKTKMANSITRKLVYL